jgi:hypothetical protein
MSDVLHLSLVPPHGWREIQLDPKNRERQIRQTLEPLRYLLADWQTIYPSLRRYLVNSYEQSWQAGIRYAITTVQEPDDPAQIFATFSVSVLPPASPTGEPEDELDSIVCNLTQERDEQQEDGSMTLSAVRTNNLGAGVQAASVEHMRNDNNEILGSMAMLRTFIPYRNRVILTTGMTPQLDISDVLFELFAHITETVQVEVLSEEGNDGQS